MKDNNNLIVSYLSELNKYQKDRLIERSQDKYMYIACACVLVLAISILI